MTQKERILDYIKTNGSINRLKAFTDCAVFELSSNIIELEKDGHEFIKENRRSKNRFGKTVHYVEYFLKD